MSAGISHNAKHYNECDVDEEYDEDSEDENCFASLPPCKTTADLRQGAGQPVLPQHADDKQHIARPATTAVASLAFPSPTFDP